MINKALYRALSDAALAIIRAQEEEVLANEGTWSGDRMSLLNQALSQVRNVQADLANEAFRARRQV